MSSDTPRGRLPALVSVPKPQLTATVTPVSPISPSGDTIRTAPPSRPPPSRTAGVSPPPPSTSRPTLPSLSPARIPTASITPKSELPSQIKSSETQAGISTGPPRALITTPPLALMTPTKGPELPTKTTGLTDGAIGPPSSASRRQAVSPTGSGERSKSPSAPSRAPPKPQTPLVTSSAEKDQIKNTDAPVPVRPQPKSPLIGSTSTLTSTPTIGTLPKQSTPTTVKPVTTPTEPKSKGVTPKASSESLKESSTARQSGTRSLSPRPAGPPPSMPSSTTASVLKPVSITPSASTTTSIPTTIERQSPPPRPLAPVPSKTSSSSIPTSPIATSSPLGSWYNNCAACNGTSATHRCCLICRNYDEIDEAAIRVRLESIRIGGSDSTVKEYLEGLILAAQAAEKEIPAIELNVENLTKKRKETSAAHKAACTLQNKLVDDYAKLSEDLQEDGLKKCDLAEQEANRLGKLDKLAQLELEKSEKEKAGAMKRKLDCEARANEAVRVVARALLQASKVDTDPVSRARFFFTWIATTIQYSHSVRKKGVYRSPATTLFKKIEVCQGYAELFKVMFDTNPSGGQYPEGERCELVRGWGKRQADDYVESAGREERRHMWNKFPFPDSSGAGKRWKVIDATWGAGAVGDRETTKDKRVQLDPTWFTKDNDEFRRDHLTEAEEEGTNGKKIAEGWWREVLPQFSADTQGYHIKKGTLSPDTSRISWSGKQKFAYEKACEHILPERMPTCGLLVYGSPQPESFARLLIPFSLHFQQGRYIWEAEVDLSKHDQADTVELYAIFERRHGPCDKASGLDLTIKGISRYINGRPKSNPLIEIQSSLSKGEEFGVTTGGLVKWERRPKETKDKWGR